jgi:hypothetical protein
MSLPLHSNLSLRFLTLLSETLSVASDVATMFNLSRASDVLCTVELILFKALLTAILKDPISNLGVISRIV